MAPASPHTIREVSMRAPATLALLLVLAAPAHAAWPSLPGNAVPVCTATNTQQWVNSVSDGSGGAIITWSDQRGGASFDIYAQHILASGSADPAWPVNGRALCTAIGNQILPQVVADASGGAIIAWYDLRASSYDVYAQHVLASGAVDPTWPADGRALCTAAGNQSAVVLVSDGAGGAIACWHDTRNAAYDIFAQHVLASGAVDPAWPVDGRAVCTTANDQMYPAIVSDGAGGIIAAWDDARVSGGSNYDIYAQHVLAAGAVDPAWPVNGIAVCSAAGAQVLPTILTDGAGGAMIAWSDPRSGSGYDIYMHHVQANGTLDINYITDGILVCNAAGSQLNPKLASDGNGGAIVTWYDLRANGDVYAQHMLASVGVDPAWPANGLGVCTAVGDQQSPQILGDGIGGAIITWYDGRNGVSSHIYAQRVLPTGSVDYNWGTDGKAVCTASGYQQNPVLVTDGAGGAIIAWQDVRMDNGDVYAQRITKSGYLGTPEAVMAGVKDVPNDNGGHVRVSWNASYLEFDPYLSYASYYLFRQIPARSAAQASAHGARLHAATDAALQTGDIITTPAGASVLYWEFIASTSGFMVPGYSYNAATTGDSLGAGNPRTLFMVQTRAGSFIANSLPDSGYSVDNIPPVTPAPFAANYAAGTTHLHWQPNPDADLANYRLYRGVGAFTIGPASLIATPADTGYADAASATYTYKLTAVDVHGNESPVATITPGGIAGVDGGAVPHELALAPASPNPAARGTTLRFALPVPAAASLGIYDAAGRLVRALASGAQAAGEHAVAWNLQDANGRNVGAGLYFARLEAGGRTLVRRIAVTP
jgi:hypothetical protein